jgi:hypothetical protein
VTLIYGNSAQPESNVTPTFNAIVPILLPINSSSFANSTTNGIIGTWNHREQLGIRTCCMTGPMRFNAAFNGYGKIRVIHNGDTFFDVCYNSVNYLRLPTME